MLQLRRRSDLWAARNAARDADWFVSDDKAQTQPLKIVAPFQSENWATVSDTLVGSGILNHRGKTEGDERPRRLRLASLSAAFLRQTECECEIPPSWAVRDLSHLC